MTKELNSLCMILVLMGVHLLILKAAWSNVFGFCKIKTISMQTNYLRNSQTSLIYTNIIDLLSKLIIFKLNVNKKKSLWNKTNYASWKCLQKEIVRFCLQMIEFIQPACYALIVSKKKKLKKNYLKCVQDLPKHFKIVPFI